MRKRAYKNLIAMHNIMSKASCAFYVLPTTYIIATLRLRGKKITRPSSKAKWRLKQKNLRPFRNRRL